MPIPMLLKILILTILHNQTVCHIPLGKCFLNCGEDDVSDEAGVQSLGQGLPGKRGPKGETGPEGPLGKIGKKGEPGTNCECVEELQNEVYKLKRHDVKDCSDVDWNPHSDDSNFTTFIYPLGIASEVLCSVGDGQLWTVLQHRSDGSLSFERNWNAYEKGFGGLNGEHWAGVSLMYRLTALGRYRLKIELEDHAGNHKFATYDLFHVDSASNKYKLTVNGFYGNAGDSLSHHSGKPFTTADNDNDDHSGNCGISYKSGWWFKACHLGNLNGLYSGKDWQGIHWHSWKHEPLKSSTMKIRRII